MASHLYVLSKVELSFAYPFLSLAYVAVAIAAWMLFSEDLNPWRIAGIAFICVGNRADRTRRIGREPPSRARRRSKADFTTNSAAQATMPGSPKALSHEELA